MDVELRPTPSGRTVVAKKATTPEEAARLRHEAEILEMARHPGVVEVLGFDGDTARPVLFTAHVEGPTLATAGAMAVEEVAGVLAALAATLADLHSLAVVHGAVAADHVLLGADGAPVLCGFGDGGRIGEQRTERGAPLDAALDVFDLGVLLGALAPTQSVEGRALRRVGEAAVAAESDGRPTARALAGSISAAVPGARLPRQVPSRPHGVPAPEPAPPPDPLDAWRRLQATAPASARVPRRAAAIAGAVALALVGIVAASLGGGNHDEPNPLTGPVALGDAPSTTLAVDATHRELTRTGPAPPTTRADCPAARSGLVADVDADGCADALRYADGVLEAGAARWSVGREGDQVATGDWSCSGLRTLALLRPSTGELFRFDGWAASGADVAAPAFARVKGGVALRAADLDQDGCHEMVVERDGGAPEVVRPPRRAP